MRDYHAEQFAPPKTACSGRNCAAASGAMAAYFGTRGSAELTAQDFRHQSGVSCVPGVDTPSGGLNVEAIERVCAAHGVTIDFRGRSAGLRRWTGTEVYSRLSTYDFGHLLGLYANVPVPWRAHGSTFHGGHSIGAHDVRDDLPDSSTGKVQRTACWHDPLRPRPIRVPWSVVERFTQSPGALQGYVGFVQIPAVPGGTYAKPMTDRTRTRYATLAVHSKPTTGAKSTTRIIRGKGKLVEVAMYLPGEPWGSGPNRRRWGALSLIGDEVVHLNRLTHTGGTT